jgi:hypothetical protein
MQTTSTSAPSISTEKLNAFEARQRDTGWGYAVASAYVPFVGLYYAITRRTVTPFLYDLVASWALIFLVAFGAGLSGATEKENDVSTGLAVALAAVASPILQKKGIDKARSFAKAKLEALD